jgi:hypothetical protein
VGFCTSTLSMKEGTIWWWWCTGVTPSDRRRLLLGANRSALNLVQQSLSRFWLVGHTSCWAIFLKNIYISCIDFCPILGSACTCTIVLIQSGQVAN